VLDTVIGFIDVVKKEEYSRLYHSLEWYTRTTRHYGITYFMTVVLEPTWAYEQRDKLVTLQRCGLWDVI